MKPAAEKPYKVHYDKWNKKWDEWVAEDRLKPDTEETRELAKEMAAALTAQQREQASAKKRKRPQSAASSTGSATKASASKSRQSKQAQSVRQLS